MATYIQTTLTAPVEGRDQEFNRWYDDTHMPEVLTVPGFITGQRYALTGVTDRPRYLAVYEIETENLAATLDALAAASATMTRSDAIDPTAIVTETYAVLGDRRTGRPTNVAAAAEEV